MNAQVEMSYSEALRAALADEMREDPRVFLLGEDIGKYGGAFGVTRGLLDEFGSERVIETPISEGGMIGVATGAALLGERPVAEIMFMDFATLVFDQVLNHAAKFHYVYGDQAKVPIVIRTPAGGGRAYGPTHSQCLEGFFLHAPGVKIVAPSTPQDAYGLLRGAIRDPNPVLFVEHKLLYPTKGEVKRGEIAPLQGARVVCPGDDVTIVAHSFMVEVATDAAAVLDEEYGVFAEVIDLRCLAPMDFETVKRSVEHTGHVVLVEEGTRTCGVMAEVGCRICEEAYENLERPVRRVATPDVPIPCSPVLEEALLPSAEKIVEAALRLLE